MNQSDSPRYYEFSRSRIPGIQETISVSEYDLDHNQVAMLAANIYQMYHRMPGPAQDMFLEKISREIAEGRQKAESTRTPPVTPIIIIDRDKYK